MNFFLKMEEQNSFQGRKTELSGWSGIAFIGQQRIGGPYFGCKYYFFKYKVYQKKKHLNIGIVILGLYLFIFL